MIHPSTLVNHSSLCLAFSMFGALLVISFCDFTFVTKHFKFLKTVTGKGYFNLFLASMFLVGSSGIWGWVMTGLFAGFGIFFIAVGCACVEGVYDDSDIKKGEVAENARASLSSKTSKTAEKDTNNGDSEQLLSNDTA